MSDSQHPLYKKGFYNGRRLTEEETARYRRQRSRDDLWNDIYVSLLPVAMQQDGWSIDGKSVRTTEDRVKLACLWTNKAIENIK